MKLNVIIAVILGFSILFVTGHAYAPCVEEPGTNCNNYPPPSLSQIKFDKLNYDTSDKPIVTIMGAPDAVAHLEIDDSSSNIIFTHDINLAPNGTVNYVLDVSSYKPGMYFVIATSPISKLTTGFTVGLMPTGGGMFLNTDKNSYLPGDHVIILGTMNSNTLVQLSLIDSNGIPVESTKMFSDNTGHFSLLNFTIPENAISGVWKIDATSGVEHAQIQITVNSTLNDNSNIKMDTAIPSPLKQFKLGVAAKDVKCKQGLELLMKSHDGIPACVKSTSVSRLLGQGWINPYNFNGENPGKESISLSAYQGVSEETFYNNGTVASNFTINVSINNFKPSNTSLVLQVYYDDGIIYKTVNVSPDVIQPDGSYKYHLIAVSDKNHPVPFKVVATYNNETATTYAPVFVHP